MKGFKPYLLTFSILGIFNVFFKLIDYSFLLGHNSIVPLHHAKKIWLNSYLSLYAFSDDSIWIIILLILQIISLIGLNFARSQKISVIACVILQLSLLNRNLAISYIGDWYYFWLTLFICLYILKKNFKFHHAIFIQTSIMYFFAGVSKYHPEWWSIGNAIELCLSFTELKTPLADFFVQFQTLNRLLSPTVVMIELLTPFLLLFSNEKIKKLTFLIIFSFHLGILLTLNLTLFTLLCMLNLVFLYRNRKSIGFRLELSLMTKALITFFIVTNTLELTMPENKFKKEIRKTIGLFHLYQTWTVFYPYPSKRHGYYLFYGNRNGKKVLLSINEDSTQDKYLPTYYNSISRVTYFLNLKVFGHEEKLYQVLKDKLCRENRDIQSLNIVYKRYLKTNKNSENIDVFSSSCF